MENDFVVTENNFRHYGDLIGSSASKDCGVEDEAGPWIDPMMERAKPRSNRCRPEQAKRCSGNGIPAILREIPAGGLPELRFACYRPTFLAIELSHHATLPPTTTQAKARAATP